MSGSYFVWYTIKVMNEVMHGGEEMSLEARLFGASFGDLTSYFSMDYLMFFLPIVILLYSIVREKWKKYFLILASYVFFWMISGW